LSLDGVGTTKTATAAVALCSVAGAGALVILAGCGGEAKPTSDEVDTGYLRVAKRAREDTFRIERATEDPPDRPGQIAREFRSFAGGVDYTATFLLTVSDPGPVGLRAFGLHHSLVIYESTLRAVVKRARRGDRSLTRALRGVRQVGAEVRASGAAWERFLRAAIAD
jgi:hypothetical protein